MVPVQQPKVALQLPTWGGVSYPIPVPQAPLAPRYRVLPVNRSPLATRTAAKTHSGNAQAVYSPPAASRRGHPTHRVLSLKESRYRFAFPYVFGWDGLED